MNAACSAIMKIEVEMTRKQRTKNKMADIAIIHFTDSKMCIVFVCMRFVKNFGCHYNQSAERSAENTITNFAKIGKISKFRNTT